jgi:hypothetical protein
MEDTNLMWRKSSYSNGGGNACLETTSGTGSILVRDTTDRAGGTLSFSAETWKAFISDLK